MAKRWPAVVALLVVGVLAACGTSGSSSASSTPGGSSDPQKAASIEKIVEEVMASKHLKAVIVRVTDDGDEVITKAFGESQTGIPASADMNFRNGSVAIAYVAAVLLQLVDEGTVSLDDTIGRWVPEIPHADEVTLGQLATMTSGYQYYVLGNDAFETVELNDPFKAWTTDEMLALAVDKPLLYKPGTNWNYAHTNYVILGLALEKITGTPVEDLLRERTSTRLRGVARTLPGCTTCVAMNERYTYGMGVVVTGGWIVQNPLFNGYAAVVGYLPETKVSIAVAVTYEAEAFGPDGSYDNSGNPIFSRIGALMAPDHAPPIPQD